MLSKRQSHIVDLLNNELKPITGRDLGKTLGVSDRTIRSDVEAINAEYGCELIRVNRRSAAFTRSRNFCSAAGRSTSSTCRSGCLSAGTPSTTTCARSGI